MRRQRGGRRLDGGIADPRVPGRAMTDAPVTAEELRAVDLFDDLDDSELAEWVAVAQPRQIEPGDVIAEAGEEPSGLTLLLAGEAQALMLDHGRSEPGG